MAHGRGRITLLSVIVLIAILVFASGVLTPSLCRSRETANRVKCASNLQQIGHALLMYMNSNRGAYPRTRATGGDEVIPVFGTGAAAKNPFAEDGPQPNDVTAAVFLLLRTQDITPEVFTCPSSNAEKDQFGGNGNSVQTRSNFTDYRKNLSYSYQNPYPANKVLKSDRWKYLGDLSGLAMAADMNPGTAGDGDNVLAVKIDDAAKDMKRANSNNHDEDGQNILYQDGHVSWESNAFAGINRENIYTTRDGKVVASPADPEDSILLPADD